MQIFTTLLPILLSSTLVFSAPVAERAYNTAKVLGDFDMITRNVEHLSGNLKSFVASPSVGIATFSSHFTDLNTHIVQTTSDALVVGSFNLTDSELIANSSAKFAQTALLSFLIALMSDESKVAAAGQKSLVLGFLNTASTATLNLFTVLIETTNDGVFDTLSVSAEELQAAFTNSISAYS